MQVIPPSHVLRPAPAGLLLGTVVGSVLLVGGLALAWLAFATPLVRGLAPSVVRPAPEQMAVGAIVWGISLVAPPCFAIVGALRLGRVASAILEKPASTPATRALSALGDEYVVAPSVFLPDGRNVRNVVLGRFGLAVLYEPPSPKAVRRHGSSWEYRRADGRWVPLENPLERAARDAERMRRWTAMEERDFIVKVHAAVVTSEASMSRTATTALIRPDEVGAWLAALPPQRSLSESRLEDLAERLRLIA